MKTNNAPQAIVISQDLINVLTRTLLLMLLALYTFTLFASPNPEKLSSFSATFDQQKVVLQWAVNDEKQMSHYIIQRSANGDEYSDVACIFTEENPSSFQEYNFQDKVKAITGNFYYRLKMVSTDGTFIYSGIRLVTISANNK